MKVVIRDNQKFIDKNFLLAIVHYMPKLCFIDNEKLKLRKLKKFDSYLDINIFTGKRKYTALQVLMIGFSNMKINHGGNVSSIEIDPAAVMPFYPKYKIVDLCSLIDKGNLELSGTNILTELYEYIVNNISSLRMNYEAGLI